MSLAIDLVVVAIIFLFILLGYKRGLIKVAFKLCTFFIAIILAFVLYKPAATLITANTNIDENIQETIISKILPEGASEDETVEGSSNLPNIILQNGENTVKSIAEAITTTLINIACLLLIFIIAKIALKFITALADLISKLPILNQFNKLGGTIYGIIEGLFIVCAAFAVISLITPLLDASLLDAINSSVIGAFFYNNNILLKFIV